MVQKEQYLEKARHGSALFPMEYYHCLYPAWLSALPVHWHEEFEITYIRKGSCTYLIDLEACPVREGDLLFFASGVLHGIPEGEAQMLETDSFVFHPQMLGSRKDVCGVKYIGPAKSGEVRFPAVIHLGEEGNSLMTEVFEKLKASFLGKEHGYELEVEALLYQFFFLLYKYVPHRRTAPENEEVIEKMKSVLQYIKENYQRPITVSDLAKVCHFSEYYFMRFFKKYMNVTCIEYLNQYRMEIAAGKLAGSSQSVTDVALDTGFQNISYFNRVFRKSYRMTPTQYRNSKQEPGPGPL